MKSKLELETTRHMKNCIYYIDTSVLLEYTTRKIHTKLHLGLEWRIFHILASEDHIDDFTDIKFAS